MQCLIVAAGKGLRLRARGNSKPLVELAGKPIIAHVVERAIAGGVSEFVVVTGHEADTLEGYLAPFVAKRGAGVRFVRNPEYDKPNGLSVLAAARALGERFLLVMSDHLMDPGIIRDAANLSPARGEVWLATDNNLANPFVDMDDVTRVKTEGRLIRAIGKGLKDYDCFDTGLFVASSALVEAIRESGDACGDWSISGGMMQLAAADKALSFDVGGRFWIDVDSPEMYHLAERQLEKEPA